MANLQSINEMTVAASGGTELLAARMKDLPSDLLDKFQIWFSRYRPEQLDPSKIQIYYLHDLPSDPESQHLANGGWDKFALLVFVSHWQKQQYLDYYGIPESKCRVILNSILPITEIVSKKDNTIRLGYWSTPHRGLEIAIPVFEALAVKHANIQFDVFSSFKLYGWEQRDVPYAELFERCRNHPKINYHGSVDNSNIREYCKSADILLYPSIWKETSCLVLMEAMSAAMACIHPDLAALPETAACTTFMYPYSEDVPLHASRLYEITDGVISNINAEIVSNSRNLAKKHADRYYDWEVSKQLWISILRKLV